MKKTAFISFCLLAFAITALGQTTIVYAEDGKGNLYTTNPQTIDGTWGEFESHTGPDSMPLTSPHSFVFQNIEITVSKEYTLEPNSSTEHALDELRFSCMKGRKNGLLLWYCWAERDSTTTNHFLKASEEKKLNIATINGSTFYYEHLSDRGDIVAPPREFFYIFVRDGETIVTLLFQFDKGASPQTLLKTVERITVKNKT